MSKLKRDSNHPLAIKNFASAFLLLGCGVCLTVFLLLLEFLYVSCGRSHLRRFDRCLCCGLLSLSMGQSLSFQQSVQKVLDRNLSRSCRNVNCRLRLQRLREELKSANGKLYSSLCYPEDLYVLIPENKTSVKLTQLSSPPNVDDGLSEIKSDPTSRLKNIEGKQLRDTSPHWKQIKIGNEERIGNKLTDVYLSNTLPHSHHTVSPSVQSVWMSTCDKSSEHRQLMPSLSLLSFHFPPISSAEEQKCGKILPTDWPIASCSAGSCVTYTDPEVSINQKKKVDMKKWDIHKRVRLKKLGLTDKKERKKSLNMDKYLSKKATLPKQDKTLAKKDWKSEGKRENKEEEFSLDKDNNRLLSHPLMHETCL